MEGKNSIVYEEVQRPRQWWFLAIFLVVAAIFWYIFVKQIFFGTPVGDKPVSNFTAIILWLIFGIAVPVAFLFYLSLTTRVYHDRITIQLFPFHLRKRTFLLKDLQNYETIEYSITNFGGWGIRMDLSGRTAYTIQGKHGVKLTFNKQEIVIGTQHPAALEEAIHSIRKS